MPSWFAASIYVGLLTSWVVGFVLFGAGNSLIFDGEGANGPFQLFNPLRRIAAGQRGGLDFQFFHGLGIPYLHYPLFRLLGGTIHASELSRHVMTTALFLASNVAVCLAAAGRRRAALPLMAAAVILTEIAGLHQFVEPGHSLLGVRATMPVLAFAVLLRPRRDARQAALLGACLGAGLLLGTEQGLAMIVALAFVQLVDLARGGPRRAKGVHMAATYLSAAAAVAIPLLLAGGPRGAARALRYNLAEVVGDQCWYFGVKPNASLTSWAQVADDREFLLTVLAGTLLLFVCLRLLVHARDAGEGRFALAASALLAYGLLACVSYLGAVFPHYLMPMKRSLLLVTLVGGHLVGERLWRESSSARRIGAVLRPCLPVVALAFLLRGYPGSLAFEGLYRFDRMRGRAETLATLARETSPGRLGPNTTAYLERATALIDADRGSTRGPFTLWSTYAGSWRAITACSTPTPTT
jgi:hypothetical protein